MATITLIVGGSIDTTTTISTTTGNTSALRCTVNPDNPREVAVVALAPSPGVNALFSAAGFDASALFAVNPAPPPPNGLAIGAWGPEIVPPSWA